MNSFRKPPSHRWDSRDDLPLTKFFDDTVSHAAGSSQSSDESEGQDPSSSDRSQPLEKEPQQEETKEKTLTNSNSNCKEHASNLSSAKSLAEETAPKPVDDDLYKIPPELLCAKPKKRMMGRRLGVFSSCLLPTCAF